MSMAENYDVVRAENCEARLELNLKVSGLRNYDVVGKSDPFAVVYVNNSSSAALPVSMTGGTGVLQPGAGAGAALGQGGGGGRGRGGGVGRGRGASGYGRHPGRARLDSAGAHIGNITAPLPALQPLGKPKFAMRRAPWEHVMTTETVGNSLEASFSTPVKITYFFERAQQVAVDVYDRDSNSTNLLAHDYLGSAIFTVSALVRAEEQCLRVPLRMLEHPRRECGFLTVVGEDTSRRRHIVHLSVAMTLRSKPRFIHHWSGPYLVFSRRASSSNREWITKFSSTREGVRVANRGGGGGVCYQFEEKRVPYEALALGSLETEVRVAVVFKVRHTEREYASACVRINEWRNRSVALSGGSMRRTRGSLALQRFDVREQPQFMDYVMGGAEIGLVVGIDFTASNGDSMQPNSLHYTDMYHSNEYETAIRSVGGILAQYDSDNEIPVFGFGAKMPPAFERVSHCFSLTGASDPVCAGIEGVLDAYRATLYQVRLSGPTEFSALVEHAARYAEYERSRTPTAYTILLILTDGVINDFQETVRAISQAAHLPLSIVIIGVGDADFTAMDALDGDHIPHRAVAQRDIVQFVPFRRFQHQPEMLAAEVLAEIPTQLVDYFSGQGIMPNEQNGHLAVAPGSVQPFPNVPFIPRPPSRPENDTMPEHYAHSGSPQPPPPPHRP